GKESAAGSAWAKITANLKPRSLLAGLLGVDLEALSGQAQEAGSFLFGQPGETGSSPQSSGRSPVQVSPAPELALPVIGQLSSGFGPRMNPVNGKPEFHTGLDLAAPDGTPVRSVLPGTVTEVVEDDRWGRNILIDHPEGWQSFYAHLSETFARKGEKVSANQVIGAVGQTGLSTGNHLHFELRRNGIPSDPAAWLAEAVSAGSP
ncbi:MAG: M23 family metallopeptidase, partial [Firmicutes bacterium]|nr:M23 family metallopeptidase [Bacillota bacterium]